MSSPGFAFMAFCSASAILATAPHVAGMTDVLRDVFHAFAGWGALVFFRAPKMGCHEQNGVCWHWVYHYSRCYEKVWVRVEPYPDNGYLKPSWNRCFLLQHPFLYVDQTLICFKDLVLFVVWFDTRIVYGFTTITTRSHEISEPYFNFCAVSGRLSNRFPLGIKSVPRRPSRRSGDGRTVLREMPQGRTSRCRWVLVSQSK